MPPQAATKACLPQRTIWLLAIWLLAFLPSCLLVSCHLNRTKSAIRSLRRIIHSEPLAILLRDVTMQMKDTARGREERPKQIRHKER